jgi:hypothetical protein
MCIFGAAAGRRERRARGNHRIEQRQRDRGADAAEHRAAGQMLLRDEHMRLLFLRRGGVRLEFAVGARNRAEAERLALGDRREYRGKLVASRAAARTTLRTAGMS